jgi:hypothetical protein
MKKNNRAPKLSDDELTALLSAERRDALAAVQATKLSEERERALEYYVGDVTMDIPDVDGRSKAVSMDVADTVEGLMPQLMEIFCSSEDVVKFEPVGREDVQAADQETDYVNHVFMQKNPGFMVLYSMIKDALLSKVGVVKVWWEQEHKEQRETYLDLDDDAFAMLAADPEIEIVEHSMRPAAVAAANSGPDIDVRDGGSQQVPGLPSEAEYPRQSRNHGSAPNPGSSPRQVPTDTRSTSAPMGVDPNAALLTGALAAANAANAGRAEPEPDEAEEAAGPMLHDVTVAIKKTYGCAKVMPVPPEEFGITRHTRTIAEAGYCFHEIPRTVGQLLDQGYDEESLDKLPTFVNPPNMEEISRDTVNETRRAMGSEGLNPANRPVVVVEHYVRMNYDGSGPALYRVTTGSRDTPILLTREGEPDIERIDFIPFAAMTPVPITHRFFGRSVADLVMDIQRIKTALLRALLDNAYLANNPRTEVSETHATTETLDDLLVSRPGGIVRTKMPGGLNILAHPDIGAQVFPLLEYHDGVREWRTGVTRQGQGIDADALQNQSATAVAQIYSVAQAKMKLIARIFAETGIRDLFSLLHATIRKHGQEAQTVRLRNLWITVDPRDWKERNDMTIQVGLGSGGKTERLAHLMAMINMQKEAIAGGLANLVTPTNLYNSARELVKVLDLKTVDPFFTDPATQPAPQGSPDPKLLQIQAQAQAEQAKLQADAVRQNIKMRADIALAERKAQLEEHKALLEAELRRMETIHELALRQHGHAMDMALNAQRAARESPTNVTASTPHSPPSPLEGEGWGGGSSGARRREETAA